MSKIIFSARKIHTMNPSMPEANYIAVDDGKIIAVGPWQAVEHLDGYRLDDTFSDKVILPGFVEGHSHALEGVMWDYLYLGYFSRVDPDNRTWSGLTDLDMVVQRLIEAAEHLAEGQPLIAWGFDPIYFEGARLDRHALDKAVSDRPVVVFHASLHVMTVNSVMLELSGLSDHGDIEGVAVDAQGVPNGELQEIAAMHSVFDALGQSLFEKIAVPENLRRYAKVARNAGVTTVTDLYNPLTDNAVSVLREVTAEDGFSVRLVPAMAALSWTPEEGISRLQKCMDYNTDKLHFGPVKMMTDGSIQGYTARMKWPGYHDGHANGIWNAPPETINEMIMAYHQAGLQLHIHANGDEAVELVLDYMDQAQAMWPRPDHRHTLQHCQIIDHAQLRRVAKLGLCLNMFANHIYYWGDIHQKHTLGYERCQRLEPLASALRQNIPVAAHCDAPITPLNPLFTAWCAVIRKTASGEVLGEHEHISVQQALEMITLGAAYTLQMDHLVGSLEIGKFADMVVLDQDPLLLPAEQLADIKVHATVLGGKVYANGQ